MSGHDAANAALIELLRTEMRRDAPLLTPASGRADGPQDVQESAAVPPLETLPDADEAAAE
ncbi:hypothetical protein [Deinococcus radiotolerans]|uniref:Uncharacterized protein n=1 Tax=Deinococcus radiotolerans TaxID=1309407 RepID=A0ABQ2FNF5_9DEIO|nr:hypothetical protein [Deinococcus radiotolerans]GGL11268.1 hypothetical protein GCM10010844_32430 [Deinococcus radiotolerans]